uniref:Uncharacterized protein n=1 Tax=Amphora coffeiformis TaxID=265554 RepID=A0A7S3L3L6_9STRA
MKNQLIYSAEAMKGFIRMHRVDRREKGPLLDITDCTQALDPERLHMFGQALREDQELQAVELNIDGLDNELAKSIAVFLGKSPKLSSVDLNTSSSTAERGVDIKLVRLFLHTFLRNPQARDLALWELRTVPPNIPLSDITKIISTCHHLETVKCCDCSINVSTALLQGLILLKTTKHVEFMVDWPSDTETSRLLQMLVDNVKTLHTLRLDSVPLQALDSMKGGLPILPDLRCLELVLQPPAAGVDEDAYKTKAAQLMANVLERTQSIERLELQGFDWTGERATLIGNVFRSANSTVKKLTLAGGPLALQDTLLGTQLLREIDIVGCDLSNATPGELQNTFGGHPGLRIIRFPELNDAQLGGLFYGMQQNATIQTLGATITELGEATIGQLCETLGSNSSLHHLALRGSDVVVPHFMKTISALLELDRCNLRSLELSGIQIGTESVDCLFQALRSNTKLERLALDDSGLNEEGALHVCRHLPFLQHLADLKLDIPEDFDEDHEDDFVRGLELNTNLTKLSFTLDNPRLESIAEFFIQKNRTNWMFDEDSRKALWPLILRQCDETSVFQWALALSDQLVSGSNKRKRVEVS